MNRFAGWRSRYGLLPTAALVAASAPRLAIAQAAAEQTEAQGSGLMIAIAIGWLAIASVAIAFAMLRHRRAAVLSGIVDALPTPRLVVGHDNRPIVATRGWQELFGAPGTSIERLADLAAKSADDGAARFEQLRRAAAAGDEANGDFRVDLPGVQWVRVSVSGVPDTPAYYMWSVENVSDRYELESIIRREQEKLIEFVENAPIGFYSVDADGRFLFVNATFAEWLGRSEVELTRGDIRLRDLLPTDMLPDCAAHSPLSGETGDAQGETTFIAADGVAFEAYVTQTVVRHEQDDRLHTRSLVRHLTEERQIAESVSSSEQHFRRLFEGAPMGIVQLDANDAVSDCNQAFAEIAGVETDAAVGRPFTGFVAPQEAEKIGEWIRDAREGEVMPPAVEARLGLDDQVPVALYAGRAGDTAVTQSGLIVHVLDMTDQKRLEAQFFQSQKMELVGQLAGGVAHDFNNLLTAMIGFCDLLLLRHTPRDQSFADIQQIKQNANRAANLVRQLLAFSRQQTLQPKVLDLTDVLSETSHLLRRLIGANIELNFYHGRDLWLVKADQGQFEQVVINLAVNARDAMAGGGALTIRTSNVFAGDPRLRAYKGIPDGDYVLLEMQDSGIGIPAGVIDKIFEPFFTTKDVGAGTGLGLSTVYGIVKQTGGYVFVDSVEGEGAKFSIYLPRYRPEEDAEAAATADEEEEDRRRDLTGAGTVMLVEDEDAVRLFGARALRNKGYHVIEAKHGENALEILNGAEDGHATTVDGERIDLLITDVVMPGVDGPALVREVRQRYPGLKVIFMSGYTEDTFRQKLGEGAEVVQFLSKPFTLQQLAGKVKEVMDGEGVI